MEKNSQHSPSPIVARVKSLLSEEGQAIRDAHFNGASGNEIVRRRTALVDRVLFKIHRHHAATSAMPAILAIGGYGRGELNPYSDIDIMLLCKDDSERECAPQLLYTLWDSGLDVGYSVRTVKECVSLAKQDIKIRTSLLESRLIAGDPVLYGSFSNAMQSDVFYWNVNSFITDKVSERLATRRKYGGSIYLREPNIKECEGGLRDFHTALWIALVHFRVKTFTDLVTAGIITEAQYAKFLRARSFLWRVRNELHYASNRRNDHLTFALQEQAAADFHYRDSSQLFAVERFMKAYFLHARAIREFSGLVMDIALRKKERGWFQRTLSLGDFNIKGRTLFPASETVRVDDPRLIMSAFAIAQERHAFFSDRLRTVISNTRIDDTARRSPETAKTFVSILNNPESLSETLTLMKDLRFLGRYLPEFRAIQALSKHDHYHQYTVDEHILLAIKNLQNLAEGTLPGISSILDAYRSLKKKWLLHLTVLLHDLGKIYREGHEHYGVDIAKGILGRLGVVGEDRERIFFLIKNHLVMATLSQRRELSDNKIIADFAKLVKDRDNLVYLYLLTFADISAVNPSSWTQWKAVLLQDLYLMTLTHFDESAQALAEERVRLAKAFDEVKEAARTRYTNAEVDDFLNAMSDQYILYTPPMHVIEHMEMLETLASEQLVVHHRHDKEKGYTEVTVCAYDAYGMFFRTAGTIASKNLSILGAQVYTSKKGVMMDTFQITDAEGQLYDYEPAWQSVVDELRNALVRKSRPPKPGLYPSARSLPGFVSATVAFDNESSDAFTIIDITAKDRVGFLYEVTKALYDLNLDIGSAKIVTEGSRAMDSFYVTDLLHEKIIDETRLGKIKDALLAIVE